MTKEWFKKKLKELYIRFNTSPKLYEKKDFRLLLEILAGLINGYDPSGGGGDSGDTKGRATYPRARWARRGFIDLTNCKDIDYIIVPCTSKQLCLYVTNAYLKKLRHDETYESIYGLRVQLDENLNPIFPENFWKVVSNYWDHFTKATGYIQPRVVDLQTLDSNELPCSANIELFINVKEIAINKNPGSDSSPLKILFNRKDTHNGFIQFPYFKTADNINANCLLSRFIFTPYMVFANPFNSTLGGVIPVRDGKLILEEATQLKNKTIELVTTGELIHFDEYGICETLFNPYTYIYLTRRKARYFRGRKLQGSYRKVIIKHPKKSPRGGCFHFRRKIRLAHGMNRRCINRSGKVVIWSNLLSNSVYTTKYSKQIPMIISRNNYTSNKFTYLCSKINIREDENLIQKLLFIGYTNPNYNNHEYKRRPSVGYLEFSPKNPPNDSNDMKRFVRYYKAPYDRANIYIINKHADITSEELYKEDLDKLDQKYE